MNELENLLLTVYSNCKNEDELKAMTQNILTLCETQVQKRINELTKEN